MKLQLESVRTGQTEEVEVASIDDLFILIERKGHPIIVHGMPDPGLELYDTWRE